MTKLQTLFTKEHIKNIFKDTETSLIKNNSKEKALEEIEKLNFPTPKTTGWEKTNLHNILRHKYQKAEYAKTQQFVLRQFMFYSVDADILVFTNGYFDEEQSIIKSTDNIYIGSLKRAFCDMPKVVKRYFDTAKDSKPNIFSSINKAYAEDGFLIYIPDNVKTDRPVHIINFIDGDITKPIVQYRNLIVAGENTKIDIVNSYHSVISDFSLTNCFTEIIMENNSEVNYHLFQGEGSEAGQINKTVVTQQANSKFNSNTATLCGTVVRNDIEVDFTDEYCQASLNGFYLPAIKQITDNSILINHNFPNCNATQNYRGAIEDHAKAIFTGKVFVAKDAQHTNSSQSNKNILLSDNAIAYSRPQLEIYADDVECSHGSTTGQLDLSALFYLQTRGISKQKAQTLLLFAFLYETLENITVKSYMEYVNYLLNKRLNGKDPRSICGAEVCGGC